MTKEQAGKVAAALGLKDSDYVTSLLSLEIPCSSEQAIIMQSRLSSIFGNCTMHEAKSLFVYKDKKNNITGSENNTVYVLTSAIYLESLGKYLKLIRSWVDAIKIVCNTDSVLMRVDTSTYPL